MVQVLVKVEQLAEGCGLSGRGPRAGRSWEGVRDDQQWHAQIHGFQPSCVCVPQCVYCVKDIHLHIHFVN